jgi:uncharacterized protein (DUF433 family)
MAPSLLDRAIYSYSDVDRLVGLHAGTAKRWLEGYTRGAKFYDPVGRELVRIVQDRVGLERSLQLVVIRNGQLVLAVPAEQFQSAVEYADDVVAHMKPDVRTPDVVMDPRRAFGQPAIRGVKTESLAEDYRAGTSREALADLYNLDPQQVDEAIRFELIAGSGRTA